MDGPFGAARVSATGVAIRMISLIVHCGIGGGQEWSGRRKFRQLLLSSRWSLLYSGLP